MTEPDLPARSRTLRESILRRLEQGPCTARDLSAMLGIRERDVVPHLEHLQRSVRRLGKRLALDPARCLRCGFVFERRRRLSRPTACPRCRGQRIQPPAYRLEPGGR